MIDDPDHEGPEDARAEARIRRLASLADPVPIPPDLDELIRERLRRAPGFARRRPVGRLRTLPLLAGAAAAALLVLLSAPPAGFPPASGPAPRSVAARIDADLPRVLSDWLVQAENATPEEVPFLAAEARDLDLLARVRTARAARGSGWLRAAEDLLVQLENDPGGASLAGEAGLVAMGRR